MSGTENQRRLRAGVIGAGFFGRLHAKKLSEVPNVTLTAVMDVSADTAQALAEDFDAAVFTRLNYVWDEVDVVVIATPAYTHFKLAKEALSEGKHVYLEKPVALNVDEADELIRLADSKGLALQVGHQERFVFSEFGVLSRNRTPRKIECRRMGPFTDRALDVSVVLDLMVHDLDLVHQVAPAPVDHVLASSKRVHGAFEDEVEAHITLSDGCDVRLTASRISDATERTMRLDYDDGIIEIDFINRTLVNSTSADLTPSFEGPDDGLPSVVDDPLGHAVGSFINSVQDGLEPVVTGADARRALQTALRVIEACHAPQN